MITNPAMTILAAACVVATLATFSVAVARRIRLWCNERDGVLASTGNFNLGMEAGRLVKQCVLAYCVVYAINDNVRVAVTFVCVLMALMSVASIAHQVRLYPMLERYQ